MNTDSSAAWHERPTWYWPSSPDPSKFKSKDAKSTESIRFASATPGNASDGQLNHRTSKERAVKHSPSQRGLLWVDAVGGFLVCRQASVTIGQAIPNTEVEIPVLGDLSRRHTVVQREGERYVIEPVEEVRVAEKRITKVELLHDGDELLLGGSVRLRFRQPHALSATARLEILSHHGTRPSCDGILLMADAMILGPDARHHVVCRNWSGQVVLSRTEGSALRYRAPESVELDGHWGAETGVLSANSRLVGPDFALSWEEM
ncbi:MAG: FHA domain-containing protein [Planctomycetales bacterium]|nr:FHA domain-containing protein [Planctomycetales bacterium]